MSDRFVQSVALVVAAASFASAATLMPMLDQDRRELKMVYEPTGKGEKDATYRLIENLGALRGIAVNMLWSRLEELKNKGKFYESDALGRRIAELQPRMPEVWRHLAYNMAYNISVKCQTQDERWAWVNKGLRLLIEEGIPNNPGSEPLYRELATIYQHKIGGESDDMNRFYKKRIANHWHVLLGAPPFGVVPKAGSKGQVEEAAIAQMREIEKVAQENYTLPNAQWAATLPLAAREKFLAAHPDAVYTLEKINAQIKTLGDSKLTISPQLATAVGRVIAFGEYVQFSVQSHLPGLAQVLENRLGQDGVAVFKALTGDARAYKGMDEMLPLLRACALIEEERMDPRLMLLAMEKFGPMDWRDTQSHAIYWAFVGSQKAPNPSPLTKLNTDRLIVAGTQGLMDAGRLFYDPVEDALSDQPDPRFIAPYAQAQEFMRERARKKEYMQWDSVLDSLDRGQENFLHRAIQVSFLFGDEQGALGYYRQVKEKFPKSKVYSQYYNLNLADFIVVTIRQDSMRVVQESAMMGLIGRGLEAALLDHDPSRSEIFFKMADETRKGIEKERGDAASSVLGTDGARKPVPKMDELMQESLRRFVTEPTHTLRQRAMAYAQFPNEVRLGLFDEIERVVYPQIQQSGLTIDPVAYFPPPQGLAEYRAKKSQRVEQGTAGVVAPDRK